MYRLIAGKYVIGLDRKNCCLNVWGLRPLGQVTEQPTTSDLPLLWSMPLNKEIRPNFSLEIAAADEYRVYIFYVSNWVLAFAISCTDWWCLVYILIFIFAFYRPIFVTTLKCWSWTFWIWSLNHKLTSSGSYPLIKTPPIKTHHQQPIKIIPSLNL